MNISSAIVKVKPEYLDTVNQNLLSSDLCEVHHAENGKIIVTIEGESSNDEIRKMRMLESLDKVLAVELIYSYSEQELENDRKKIEFSKDQPEWLNDTSMDAKDIPYNGNLKKRF